MKKDTIEKLAAEVSNPCVTISMNTHRTHPENAQDIITLKNLLNEAKDRVISEFGKRPVSDLLEKIDALESDINADYHLDSLHIFLSNSTNEVIKSAWPVESDTVQIGEKFSIKPLIKAMNRSEEYLILLLSQSGVNLFLALNDGILEEIKNDDFPFSKNPHYLTQNNDLSDSKKVDNMVREYLNTVDKALVRVHNETNLQCVVICTEDNYSRLMQVADNPSMYHGYVAINYNDTANHTIAAAAWKLIAASQLQNRKNAIEEMQEAVGQGNVITDLSDIFRAVKEGRGDLLIMQADYQQAVKMTGENSFDYVDDATQPDVIDDITSEIAWEVISKKGRAIFLSGDEANALGDIALKVRY